MADYSKFTKKQLQELLKERGLQITGKVLELRNRLEENDKTKKLSQSPKTKKSPSRTSPRRKKDEVSKVAKEETQKKSKKRKMEEESQNENKETFTFSKSLSKGDKKNLKIYEFNEEDLESQRPTKSLKSSPRKKDPNAPKRPMTAFLFFMKETREATKKEMGTASHLEVMKMVAQNWKELENKSAFEEKASEDKQRYQNEMKEYEKSKTPKKGKK